MRASALLAQRAACGSSSAFSVETNELSRAQQQIFAACLSTSPKLDATILQRLAPSVCLLLTAAPQNGEHSPAPNNVDWILNPPYSSLALFAMNAAPLHLEAGSETCKPAWPRQLLPTCNNTPQQSPGVSYTMATTATLRQVKTLCR